MEKPVVLVTKPERINEEVSDLLKQQLNDFDTAQTLVIASDSLLATKYIVEFYEKNNFTVTWSDKGKYNKPGDSLFTIIKNAEEYGLDPNEYHYLQIDSLFKTERDTVTKKYDAVKITKADILMTDAFFTFAVHVSKGRLNPDSLVREWKEAQMNINLVDLLNDALKQNTIRTVIDTLQPKNKQYHALKKALKEFRIEFKDSDWDSLATRQSDSTTFNQRLKERLVASHDYTETPGDSDTVRMANAIKNFQYYHHLTEDGKVGKLTFQALQKTKKDYIQQLEMNMERWRMYNYPSDKKFVWVNIPKYEMRVVEEDTIVMESRVIVGEPKHKTPLLKSTIRYFIIYPYWNVPYSIATKEILPILKRDTSYLRRKNFDVLNNYGEIITYTPINWKKYSKTYFPFRLRQRMGDDNSLGILKFNFENKYGVYLHDTDGRRLFKREMRALSHGCIRLEKFIDFAHFIIRDDSVRYPFDSLKMDLLKEEQKYVYARKPLPIYVNYFSAEVNDEGELFFFLDVYRRDEKMLKALGYK
ncbi:MAG: L,D-transpeptidase family protein [Bacteroidia bacterium]